MLKIPGPAKLGDGEDKLDSAYSSFSKSTGNGYASYTYQTEDYSVKVRFRLDTDNKNYNSITFENRNWDY